MSRAKVSATALRVLVYAAAAITVGALAFVVGYILYMGIPNITPSLFEPKYNSQNASIVPALINTVIIALLSLLMAVPLGVGSAIYLVEYATPGNRFVKIVRTTAETLSGIPSIVYGLFGYLLFVVAMKWGYSILAGACTLAIMVLPLIMRTTEEGLIAVPIAYREGSFGLGAGRLRTVFRIILPSAMPSILSGIVLALGRIVGETAALIYTAGTDTSVPSSLMSSGRTLAIHMYMLWNTGLQAEASYATAAILLVVVLGLNALSSFIAKRVGVKNG